MRIHPHLRVRWHIQNLVRRIRRFAVTFFVLLVLFGSVVVGKNIFLGQLRSEVQKAFRYGDLRMSYFPPAIILEDVRSIAGPPLFRARRVRVELPFLSLLRNEKSVNVLLEGPQIRVRPETSPARGPRQKLPLSLPFTIGRGLIQDGTFSFESEQGFFEARGIKALFTQRSGGFVLKATSEKSTFTSIPEKLEFSGSLNIDLTGKGQEVRIQRLTVEGPDVAVKAEGRLRNLQDPEFDIDMRFEVETAYAAALLNLPFQWKGKAGGQGKLVRKAGQVSFNSDIGGDRIVLNEVPMGRIRGRLDLRFGTGGTVDIGIQKPNLPPESVSVSFRKGRVEGRVSGVLLDPIMKNFGLAWPVKSPAWGAFSMESDKLDADAEFRDQKLDREGDRFSFRGAVKVRFNVKTQDLEITTRDIQSNFARLEARAALRVGGNVDTEIRGTVTDLKQAREFISLAVGKPFVFPEIRGAGFADVQLTGSVLNPRVAIKGSFEPGGFDLFNAAYVEGEAVIFDEGFQGKFRAEDPDIKADVQVSVDAEKTEADIRSAEGELTKVFAALQIPISLAGRAAGDFHVVQTLTSQGVSGTFTSPEVRGYGQTFSKVTGRLEWRDGILSFPEIGFDLYGGRIQGHALFGTADQAFDADLRGENIDISRLTPKVGGVLSLDVAGRGVFGKDKLTGHFAVRDFLLPPVQKNEVRGEFSLDDVRDSVALDIQAAFLPGDNEVRGLLSVPLAGDALAGSIKGHWTNLDLLLPWTGAKGRLDFNAELRGTKSSPHVSGTVGFAGPLLPFPRFAHALTDYSGTLQVEDGRITASDLKGKLGGGDVKGSGEIGLGPSGVETIDVTMDGKDMQVAPLERTRALVDGTARLIKDNRQFVLDGDFLIKRLTWRREIYEKFSFSSQTLYTANYEPGFFDNLSLNLRLRAVDNALMDNSLGRVSGRFDLSITGDINDPILLGDIEALKGNVNFQDQTFRVLKGRLSFFNPASVEPYLELKAETYVKDYRVTMTLSGPASRLKPEFSSSPPMPAEDVLALLAMGEAFKNTYSYDPERSNSLSTASLLSFQIADQAKKRAEGLFTLDRFRIDPFVTSTSAEMTARLTLGKKLSRNLLFMYSTNLATEREEIYRMEWEVSNDFSLVGVRDELGRVSFDLKFRKRF
ncbi:MAG: translocation/assembly module TamB domain-containing protein [Candidatus Aminicenantales bacterium]